jgi:hypothetical protein
MNKLSLCQLYGEAGFADAAVAQENNFVQVLRRHCIKDKLKNKFSFALVAQVSAVPAYFL